MPTCSSSVARARRSLREGAMTTQALDANAILDVAGRAVGQPTRDGTATGPEALPSSWRGSAPPFCGTALHRSPSAAQI